MVVEVASLQVVGWAAVGGEEPHEARTRLALGRTGHEVANCLCSCGLAGGVRTCCCETVELGSLTPACGLLLRVGGARGG